MRTSAMLNRAQNIFHHIYTRACAGPFLVKLKGMANAATCDLILFPYGVKRSKHFFPECSHVAYQVKGNGANSTMQAHILSLHTLSIPVVGSKVKTFFSESSQVAYQIKGTES